MTSRENGRIESPLSSNLFKAYDFPPFLLLAFRLCSFLGKGLIKVKPPAVWQAIRNPMTRHVYDKMLKVSQWNLLKQIKISS